MVAREQQVLADTRRWLELAVIGLNLCPFAKAVYVKEQIRFVVSPAQDAAQVSEHLRAELAVIIDSDPQQHDTTLLILPEAFADFLAFNDFLDRADRLVRKQGLEGLIQVASFHPHYRFADAQEDDDIANYTNRAPYPILHLLREDSVDQAVAAFPDAASIYEANLATLRKLGRKGWAALRVGPGES